MAGDTLPDAEHCGPPWTIFSDGGRPYAIMPAGRPGDVAIVKDLDPELVLRLVRCANAHSHDVNVGIHRLTERLEAIRDRQESAEMASLRARLAMAEAVIEAADALTVDVRTLRAQAASEAYDKARLALQAFDRAANPETERGTPVANAQETAAEVGKGAER